MVVERFLDPGGELSCAWWSNVQESLYIQSVVIDSFGISGRCNGGKPLFQQWFQKLSVSFSLLNQSVKSILCFPPEGSNYLLPFFLGELVVVLFRD
jgi:hypothetical protein